MSVRLKSVTLDLPVYNSNARSLRKTLTSAAVGGALMARRDNLVVVRALSNISLDLRDGDRVALVGGNGAGKTSLLKVLAGVYAPSAGEIEVQGAVSPALNLGLGLDMDLTGRANIFCIGYYRGFSRRVIEENLPDIIEMADLGSFIDLPVSTYSSGMIGRLTFACATAFRPDILLMDEWILAGDLQFMTQAFTRTVDFVKGARILVLATHNIAVVRQFCNRAAYLRAGQLEAFGDVEDVLRGYLSDTAAAAA